MKKLIMVILPPVVVFLLIDVIIKYAVHYVYPASGISTIGDGTPEGLMTYYKTFKPFLFVIALLTQATIALFIWKRIVWFPKTAFWRILGLIFLCAVLAIGLSYVIWDHATGTGRFIHICWFMTAVQAGYWLINFALLRLIDYKSFARRMPEKREEEATEET